jgi:surface antigen
VLGARFSKEVIGLGLALGLALALAGPLSRLISDGPSSWTSGSLALQPQRKAAAYNLQLVPYGIDRGFCDRTTVAEDLKDGVVPPANLLVGNAIGAKMDEADQECVSNALEYAPDQQRVLWRNPDNGLTYTVIAMQTYRTDRGIYCREYSTTTNINGRQQDVPERACRQPSGIWSVTR